ncbi:pyruvate dehydrogenase kinase [Myriangium duriaei CBS 260.36]|uniref:Protein-serine/threonine kinase n=1 Tax=Myriangium duriaei CBS 260.36 TaxID=1168546 RepID=A0A9P4MN93_9PEZI|nr:pyruvate dehydrogenase kinase [Myriangium duriaei CBS 260.36]
MLRTTWAPHLPLDVRTSIARGCTLRCYSSDNNSSAPPPWRPSAVLDEWVEKEARPISLRQLTVFGRTLTESRLLSSANYVRLELPTRIAHRLRNMQTLPYTALTNRHISQVHELYYTAFERLRRVQEIRTLEDNQVLCGLIRETLQEHLSVIPALAMGVLEIRTAVPPEVCDRLMTTMLRSRISRRVIAEQHLALTETFHSDAAQAKKRDDTSSDDDYVGQVLLRCSASEIVSSSAASITRLVRRAYGPSVAIPRVELRGDLDSTFPYIPSHIEYIIGELLRNSIQASIAREDPNPPPIDVLVCEAQQHLIIRVSDQAGGVDPDVLPYLWSFAKGPRRDRRLRNLERVPRLAGTAQEVALPPSVPPEDRRPDAIIPGSTSEKEDEPKRTTKGEKERYPSSLASITARGPELRLGIGLPISRIYAEYWAGSLEVHSLEGYGTDAFLQVSKLGNRNETLSTRASMDAL